MSQHLMDVVEPTGFLDEIPISKTKFDVNFLGLADLRLPKQDIKHVFIQLSVLSHSIPLKNC
jgi:hypothetical protein